MSKLTYEELVEKYRQDTPVKDWKAEADVWKAKYECLVAENSLLRLQIRELVKHGE